MQIVSWIVLALLLVGGAISLRYGAREFATQRALSRRFQSYLSPNLAGAAGTPWGLGALEWLGHRIIGADMLKDLQSQLLQAGLTSSAAPFIFTGLRFISTLAVFAILALPRYLAHGNVPTKTMLAALFAGFIVYRAFTILLKARIETRQREVRRELPYVLDLVLMVLDSGVSIDQALSHITGQVGRIAPVCSQFLIRYTSDIEDGVPYDLALDRLGQRLAITEGQDFAGLLKQNLLQGGELSPPLRRLAIDIGETRLAIAREQMGRKSIYLTLVMLVFFMPVLMVALAGPAVSDVFGTLDRVAHEVRR